MSGERFLDDLARTLAEPMPRRRALRLAGASLAAVLVPGFRPRTGRAASTRRSATCGPDTRSCTNVDTDPISFYCCGPPANQFECGDRDNGYKCRDTCAGASKVPCRSNIEAAPGAPGERASWTKFCCGVKGQSRCVDGTCLPLCEKFFPGSTPCGKTCCPPTQQCKAGKCVTAPCPSGRALCGRNNCCPRNWRCADASKRLCKKCARGQEACGPNCCPRGSYCCNDKSGICCTHRNGSCCGDNPICCEGTDCCKQGSVRSCCPRGEKCSLRGTAAGLVLAPARNVCCPPERVVPLSGGSVCCQPGYLSLGGKLVVPPGGGGGLCCEASRVCGSGRAITCCGRNPASGINQVCRNGQCVDA